MATYMRSTYDIKVFKNGVLNQKKYTDNYLFLKIDNLKYFYRSNYDQIFFSLRFMVTYAFTP